MTVSVRVQVEDFDAGHEMAVLRRGNPKVGAVASFIGVVRDINEGDAVSSMFLEHYPGMTEREAALIYFQDPRSSGAPPVGSR
jgi:molybdopterin synthase catalytic subunit